VLEGDLGAGGLGLDHQGGTPPDASHELDRVLVVLVLEYCTNTGHAFVELTESIETLLHIAPKARGVGTVQEGDFFIHPNPVVRGVTRATSLMG
tara:strand:+ start:73 stop:354 length:282 start_codon:yes stop_codon:yes gene_type:complete